MTSEISLYLPLFFQEYNENENVTKILYYHWKFNFITKMKWCDLNLPYTLRITPIKQIFSSFLYLEFKDIIYFFFQPFFLNVIWNFFLLKSLEKKKELLLYLEFNRSNSNSKWLTTITFDQNKLHFKLTLKWKKQSIMSPTD